jgi:hypothetical protein
MRLWTEPILDSVSTPPENRHITRLHDYTTLHAHMRDMLKVYWSFDRAKVTTSICFSLLFLLFSTSALHSTSPLLYVWSVLYFFSSLFYISPCSASLTKRMRKVTWTARRRADLSWYCSSSPTAQTHSMSSTSSNRWRMSCRYLYICILYCTVLCRILRCGLLTVCCVMLNLIKQVSSHDGSCLCLYLYLDATSVCGLSLRLLSSQCVVWSSEHFTWIMGNGTRWIGERILIINY